jgi:hypothetical protein
MGRLARQAKPAIRQTPPLSRAPGWYQNKTGQARI